MPSRSPSDARDHDPDPARGDGRRDGAGRTAASPTVGPEERPGQEGRRQRLRRETLSELKAAALDEVRERGGVGLSLRGVARRMGMSAPGLYRYVDSRETLLTVVIADGYHDLADHLARALDEAQGGVVERVRDVAVAYRRWGVEHANEYGLLFGDPIPGYAAPPEGPTTEGMRRVGVTLATPLIEAWRQGRLRVDPAFGDPALAEPLAAMAELGEDLPTALRGLLLTTWGRLHGQVSLEVFGHHAWLFPQGCEPLFRADVEALLSEIGLRTRP